MNPLPNRRSDSTPNRIRIVLAVGFGLLVVLIAFSGFSALSRSNRIHAGIFALHEADHQTEELLARLRSDLQLSAITVRDFLLDPTADAANARNQLRRMQDSTNASLDRLQPLTQPQDAAQFNRMRREVADTGSLSTLSSRGAPPKERPTARPSCAVRFCPNARLRSTSRAKLKNSRPAAFAAAARRSNFAKGSCPPMWSV